MQTDASKCRFLSFQYELSNKKIRGGGGYPEVVNPVSRRNVPTRTSRESLTSKRRRRGQIIDGLGPSMGWVGLGDEKWTQGGSNKCPAPAPCTFLSNTPDICKYGNRQLIQAIWAIHTAQPAATPQNCPGLQSHRGDSGRCELAIYLTRSFPRELPAGAIRLG